MMCEVLFKVDVCMLIVSLDGRTACHVVLLTAVELFTKEISRKLKRDYQVLMVFKTLTAESNLTTAAVLMLQQAAPPTN